MNRERLFEECARLASGKGNGAVASVGRRRGSLPMSATAKMVVTCDGARFGTVGGGCLEAEITERALEVAQSRIPAISEHTLNSDLAGDYGLTCGGTAMMFIEPVYADQVLASVYGESAALLLRGERGVLVTGPDWSAGVQKVLVKAGGVIGSGDERLSAAASRINPLREEPELDDTLLVEPLVGAPRLVVFGGGHVGAKVAQAAAFAGWRVTVADDRPEFADPVRLPFAERTLVCDYGSLSENLGIDAATYIVICTRGHQHDALIAEQVARLDTRYLGMLGSRRKVALTWKMLESWGVPAARLALVHAPIGMAIGADTPEEIAISVVAEMIAVRRSEGGRRGVKE
ncbi:MAG: XdhC family protein [Gemmatimonadaceae bacterium]|nr:XdhC family protein [Gemmatimonadaceae bacterium]